MSSRARCDAKWVRSKPVEEWGAIRIVVDEYPCVLPLGHEGAHTTVGASL